MDRKCTRHNWCTLRKFSKSSKVNLPLPDLHDLLLTLALVILIRILTLGRLLVSGAIPSEVRRTSTSKATARLGCWKLGLGLDCCCWGIGGLAASCCWGGLKTQLCDGGFLYGALEIVFCTKRYLGGCAPKGPVSAFLFFSAWCAVMQSSWVMAIFTSSLKLLGWTRLRHSLSLVLRPRQKRSCFLASLSAWHLAYWQGD